MFQKNSITTKDELEGSLQSDEEINIDSDFVSDHFDVAYRQILFMA